MKGDSTTFRYVVELRQCLDEILGQDLASIVAVLSQAYRRRAHVFILGNGGSSATAAHLASDLRRPLAPGKASGLKAFCLTDNVPLHTAIANDVDFPSVFALQLAAIMEGGDVVIAISGSGDSANVLEAVKFARQGGAITVALVGFGGGWLARLVDHAVVLSSRNYGPVEDTHLCLAHLVAQLLRERVAREEALGQAPASS